jgi:hypothetical protein
MTDYCCDREPTQGSHICIDDKGHRGRHHCLLGHIWPNLAEQEGEG